MNEPCNICGEPVRLVRKSLPRMLFEEQAEQIDVRVCTSRRCASNTGQRTLGETV